MTTKKQNTGTKKSTTKSTTNTVTIKRIGKYAGRFRSVDIYVFERKIDIYGDTINVKQIVSLIFGDRVINSRVRNILSQYSHISFAKQLYIAIARNDKENAAKVLHRWINNNVSAVFTILAKSGIRLRNMIMSVSIDGLDRDSVISWIMTILKYYNVKVTVRTVNTVTILTVPVLENNLFGYRKVLFMNTLSMVTAHINAIRDMRKRFVVSGPRS